MKPRRKIAPPPTRLAILGAGEMGRVHAARFGAIPGCEIVAAMDIDRGHVQTLCRDFNIPTSCTSLTQLLNGPKIDAVSIVTPDRFHGPYAIECLQAGKHVMCEKPLAISYREALLMAKAARDAGTVNIVNFSYRAWPCIQALREAVENKILGEIRHVEASYLQGWLLNRVWGDWRRMPPYLWRLSSRFAPNGTVGDIGVHILDFVSYSVGPIKSVYCRLRTYPKAPRNRIGRYSFDANDSAALSVEFANGALGSIHMTRWSAGDVNRLYLKISGTKGTAEIDSGRSREKFRLCAGRDVKKAVWREVSGRAVPDNFYHFIDNIRTGNRHGPDFSRGAQIQEIVDACFVSSAVHKPAAVKWHLRHRRNGS